MRFFKYLIKLALLTAVFWAVLNGLIATPFLVVVSIAVAAIAVAI